jgi:hypothetical protein
MNIEPSTLRAAQQSYRDYNSLLEDYYERGWTDGLPIVPPTPAAVFAFLGQVGIPPEQVIGSIPTRDIAITAETIAINAVMAGCKPNYMPLVLAAARAMLHPDSNAHCVTATLAGASQVVIVHGPARRTLDINCGLGCLGPGYRANATIGRALRLLIRNGFNTIPGGLDRAVFSSPYRIGFCFGEDEEGSSWLPAHVERGLNPDKSAVSIASFQVPVEMRSSGRTPDEIMDSWAEHIRFDEFVYFPQTGLRGLVDVVIIVGFDHRKVLVEACWTKARIRSALWDRLKDTRGVEDFAKDQLFRLGRPEGFFLVAAGSGGNPVSLLLPAHCGLVVTEAVDGI